MSTKIITVIVTCHSEGILLHRTLRSVYRSLSLFNDSEYEVIIHADNSTLSTDEYLNSISDFFPSAIVLKNTFGDPGLSRNFAIQQASGEYIATIDGDDIMSRNWIKDAVDSLKKQKGIAVAHSELTVEFEGADSLVLKHGGEDLATDTLLSVYSNRWNSVIVAKRAVLLANPYTESGNGFGYEDWHLNNQLIAAGAKHILIPETVIFVRRKTSNSVWLSQAQSMFVLRKNSLLSFSAVRSIENPFSEYLPKQSFKISSVRSFIKKYPALRIPAQKTKSLLFDHLLKDRRDKSANLPTWLIDEWKSAHTIDRQLYPTKKLLSTLDIHDSLTIKHKIAGALYKEAVDNLKYDSYDYLLFTPWLSAGGADKFVINYANSIAESNPNKRVIIVATQNVQSTWKNKLNDSVDFLDFGVITRDTEMDIKYRVISHLIENGDITHIHIVNSEFGYAYVHNHSAYIDANKKVVITSFSQSVEEGGRLYGYSHTHVPHVYDIASLITTDNAAVTNMWHDEYGFDGNKMRVHRTPVLLGKIKPSAPKMNSKKGELRVLWAARLAPEKLAPLVLEIGELLKGTTITIDMYGNPDHDYPTSFLKSLPSNVKYKGGFSGFFSLPLNRYDAFLYTSIFDGMPNVLLEAAEAHLPIVASSVGGIPEFITKDNGILIEDIHNPAPYANALQLLSNSPEKRSLYSNHAYESLQTNYSKKQYDKSVKEMLKTIDY